MANPTLKKWQWAFKHAWKDTALETMRAFADFVDNDYGDLLDLPGPMRLRGEVYGRQGFDDGESIDTSTIVSIERIPVKGAIAGDCNSRRFIAVTQSGSRYELQLTGPDGMNPEQFLALGAIFHEDLDAFDHCKIWYA